MTVSLGRLPNTGAYVQNPFGQDIDPSPVIIAVTASWAIPPWRLPGGNTITELSISGVGISALASGSSLSSAAAGLGPGDTSRTGWSTMAMHLETSLSDAGG